MPSADSTPPRTRNPAELSSPNTATAIQVRHEENSNAFLGSIRAIVEARVLETLRIGRSLPDMEKHFKILRTVQSLYLEDAQWRAKSPYAPLAASRRHDELCDDAPEIDFMTHEEIEKEGPAHPDDETDVEDLTDLDYNILQARLALKREPDQSASEPCTTAPPTVEEPSALEPEIAKTPEIPQIPLNSTSLDSEDGDEGIVEVLH